MPSLLIIKHCDYDRAELQRYFIDILQRNHGMAKVHACNSLTSAEACLASHPVGAIAMGAHFFDGDSLEFFRKVRATPANTAIPVVFITQNAHYRQIVGNLRQTDRNVFHLYPHTDYTQAVARHIMPYLTPAKSRQSPAAPVMA